MLRTLTSGYGKPRQMPLFRSVEDAIQTGYQCSFYECRDAKEIPLLVKQLEEKLGVQCHHKQGDDKYIYLHPDNTETVNGVLIFAEFILLLFLTIIPGLCWLTCYCMLLKGNHI